MKHLKKFPIMYGNFFTVWRDITTCRAVSSCPKGMGRKLHCVKNFRHSAMYAFSSACSSWKSIVKPFRFVLCYVRYQCWGSGMFIQDPGSRQCGGSGMFIPDPGSWFLPIPDPGSRIPDPGSRIPDPKTATKERGEKKFGAKWPGEGHDDDRNETRYRTDELPQRCLEAERIDWFVELSCGRMIGLQVRPSVPHRSAKCLSFSVFLSVAGSAYLWEREGGRGRARSPIKRPQESLGLYKIVQILSVLKCKQQTTH